MGEAQRVSDVGEFGLISQLRDALPIAVREGEHIILGIGDDAAVWQPSPGEQVVITTDSLVEGVHFRTDWSDWRRLGYKTLAVNVSDLAAMGAVPRLAVITLALTGEERVADLIEMYRGLGDLAGRYSMAVAGGDIVRSPHGVVLHVTALGETRGGELLTRSGARPGDIIGVTGTLGASAAGLKLLALSGDDPRRRAATAELLIEAHLRPEPRVAIGAALLTNGASAAMDLSDGLFGDLPKILAASGVSARIDESHIPVAAAVRALFPDEWLELAERGGEDYELLFTVPPERWSAAVSAIENIGGTAAAIGEITPAHDRPQIAVAGIDGVEREVPAGAFDHFAT